MGLAIVTGGAGAIGRACARALVEDGWRVALADIDLAEAEAVAHGIGPGAVAAYRLDVTEFDAVHAVAGRIAADHGPVTGLVTAAGGGRNLDLTFGPFIETGPEEWDRNIEVHLNGVYHTCHAVLPLIIAAGGGAIVNTASGAGIRGGPPHLRQRFASVYSACKAGVIALTQAVAQEAGPLGVRANCIAPGRTETRAKPIEEMERLQGEEEALRPGSGRASPLGRFGRGADMGNAAAFLMSDRAGYITGACLDVTGGIRLH
jgi:2-hydroxycyclohexanecarboxyl-CoA dehydrogenase